MNRSFLIAGGIALLLGLYLVLGTTLFDRDGPSPLDEVKLEDSLGRAVMTVRVRPLEAVEIAREVVVQGHTEPARRLELRAETSGTVASIEVSRGERVEAGTAILRLDPDTRPERIRRAEAELAARRIELRAAERLADQELTSDSALAAARTVVAMAEEALADMRLDLERTIVRAPFAGIVNDRTVEIGDFLQPGDAVASLLELDPLVIEGEVTELQINYVRVGEHGVARLADGREVDGAIRFVSTEANPATRTFAVELEVPNPGAVIPAGKSAEIVIETDRVRAYEVSAAHISIDDEGHFGVKYVDESDTVRFAPVDVVRSTPRTLWLAGLPDQLRLITIGQGFTQPGDTVKVVEEKPLGD